MISEKTLRLIDQSRHLLPPSGAYAMGELIAEVRRLQGILLPPTIAERMEALWIAAREAMEILRAAERGDIFSIECNETKESEREGDKFLALLGKEQS